MAKKNQTGNESEWHIVAARLRVTGAGELKMKITSYDNGVVYEMVPLNMVAATRIEPTRLANVQSQRLRFEGYTDEIDEKFRISRIILFAKPVAVEYPM